MDVEAVAILSNAGPTVLDCSVVDRGIVDAVGCKMIIYQLGEPTTIVLIGALAASLAVREKFHLHPLLCCTEIAKQAIGHDIFCEVTSLQVI